MDGGTECANPLLLRWVGEWLETARGYNSKGATIYKKAYDSIKACPIAFSHPSEAQQLHGLGPKICDRLTEKLKTYCSENGLPFPELPHKSQKRQQDGTAATAPPKKTRKVKAYVPALRSGPYAIILALASISEESANGLTKVETIELAQPHCDSSFSAPSEPGKFYTAWNSMKTLIDKEFVYERGRPLRKYALTEEGWEVAKRIKGIESDKGATTGSDSQNGGQHLIRGDSGPSKTQSSRTNFRQSKDGAVSSAVMRTEETARNSRQRPVADFLDLSYEEDSPSNPFGLDAETSPSGRQALRDIHKDSSESVLSNSRRGDSGVDVQPTFRSQATARSDFVTLSSSPRNGESPPEHSGTSELSNQPYALKPPADFGLAKTLQSSAQELGSGMDTITLAPFTFTVHLVLDNREIRAKQDRDYFQDELTRRGVKPIMRSLECGDALWVAKCNDPKYLESRGEEGSEVVLDWIVERKRLDDLVGSIKDGRFHEQKFRLRKSGIKNVIYIIEEISKNSEAISRFQDSVESAIASTQVVNGFFLKKTMKLDDTIRYLARMTALLKSMYENKSLHVIPTRLLTPQTYLTFLASLPADHHLTYSAFASLASKSDSLTLRDLFLKMLMCTRGVTGDKALAVQKIWKTPKEFIQAYENMPRPDATTSRGATNDPIGKAKREMVFLHLGNMVGRKKIGKALSSKIAEVWAHGRDI
ncbi:MAG: K(+)/H(+) antiporter [Chaenotheca gracillima]|nr:MAG: K(+)/H(+) antiporter [Chaenotheca gracillima]